MCAVYFIDRVYIYVLPSAYSYCLDVTVDTRGCHIFKIIKCRSLAGK